MAATAAAAAVAAAAAAAAVAAAATAAAAAAATRAARGDGEGGAEAAEAEATVSIYDLGREELYIYLDAAVEAEDYDRAALIKERIDELLNTGPQLWSIKDGS